MRCTLTVSLVDHRNESRESWGMKSTVAVLGSLNMDLVAAVERLPAAGETVAARAFDKKFGGKGANQAMAAARQGAKVRFIGCVGDDVDGRAYRRRLREEGIDVGAVRVAKGRLTGSALIGVDRKGENLIMVAAAANGVVSRDFVREHRRKIEQADVLLVQFEVSFPAVVEAIRIANRAGVPVVVNPSPSNKAFPWGKVRVQCVIVNEAEAKLLLGGIGVERCRARMKRLKIERLIVTRGRSSTLSVGAEGTLLKVDTLKVRPVDTVGAGDAFAGAVATCVAEGLAMERAIELANAAGALATLERGAQESIPTRRQTVGFLRRKKQPRIGQPSPRLRPARAN